MIARENITDYQSLLTDMYPENRAEIAEIIARIREIMKYLDVQYGIDNPVFMDLTRDPGYLVKVILPWMFKYAFTVRKISRLNKPVVEYLQQYTRNQSLLDIITQHFFRDTPTFFALSYLSLYLDYYYPRGGTGRLAEGLTAFIEDPFALFSLFDRDRTRSTAGFGWLAALAPVVAKGIGSLIGSKQQKSVQKQQEETRRLEAQRADELARQQWEAQQGSPAAQGMRFKNTLQLGRLAGAMGGLDKLPPSIANYYQSLRKMPEYSGTSSYIPTPKRGGGGWDFAGGVLDALSYLDTDQLKAGRTAGRTPSYNPRASSGA